MKKLILVAFMLAGCTTTKTHGPWVEPVNSMMPYMVHVCTDRANLAELEHFAADQDCRNAQIGMADGYESPQYPNCANFYCHPEDKTSLDEIFKRRPEDGYWTLHGVEKGFATPPETKK